MAGDIRDDCDSDEFMANLLANVYRCMLFDTPDQDAECHIAVRDESIRGIGDDQTPAARKANVICHHLNCLAADARVRALAEVEW